MGSAVKNIGTSVGNLGKGKNILSSALSLSTAGIIGPGEEQEAKAQSFSDRLTELENSGAFGGMTLQQAQAKNQAGLDFGMGVQKQGVGYTGAAAENALAAMRGQQPSIANMQFQQNLQDSIAAQNAMAQTGGVDAALAYRIAAEQADKQRQAAVLNSAMLRAAEIQQGRQDLGNFGNALSSTGLGSQTLYSNNMANNANVLNNLQATATQQQQQAQLANQAASNAQMNALIGAAGQAGAAYLTGGASAAAKAGAQTAAPGTLTAGRPAPTPMG